MGFRFKAKIVPKVLKQNAFKGLPRGTASQYDVDEKTAQQLHDRINANGIPLVYNHTDSLRMGTVICASRDSTGALDIEAETDESTWEGQEATKWIKAGKLCAVSLRHLSVVNRPEEVSLCWEGARGPEAKCHSIWDSNTKSYIPINASPTVIAASSLSHAEEEDEILDFFPLSQVTVMSLTIAASATEAAVPAPAASPSSPSSPPPAAATPPDNAMTDTPAPSIPSTADLDSLLNSNKIPSKEQKLAAKLSATDLALALTKMQQEREEVQSQLAELRAIKEAEKKKKEEEANKKKELQRKVVGDFRMTYARSDEERKAVPAAVAAMNDETLAAVYESATCVKASLFHSMQTKESELEQQSLAKIQEFLQAKNIQTFNPPPQQQSMSIAASSSSSSMDTPYQSWLGNQHREQLQNNKVLFEDMRRDPSIWGVPQESPPKQMVIAASANYSRYLKPTPAGRSTAEVKWEPGQGLNFDWAMLEPGQAAVYALHGTVNMLEGGTRNLKFKDLYSGDAQAAAAKYRKDKDNTPEYQRILASSNFMGNNGSEHSQLPTELDDGEGGMAYLMQKMRVRRY